MVCNLIGNLCIRYLGMMRNTKSLYVLDYLHIWMVITLFDTIHYEWVGGVKSFSVSSVGCIYSINYICSKGQRAEKEVTHG